MNHQGLTLREQYLKADPFPHIVLDDFLEPQWLVGVTDAVNAIPATSWDGEEHRYSRLKDFISYPGMMPQAVRRLAEHVNSPEMCQFLTDLTGIEGVQGDNSFVGGGLHRIRKGGKLGIHADFNIHPVSRKHRRINLLIYLNPVWQADWGGELELWKRDMSACVKKIEPIFNRAVIFTITDDAFHGHPEPMQAEQRLSFAAYYYTNDRPAEEKAPFHWATWKDRPKDFEKPQLDIPVQP